MSHFHALYMYYAPFEVGSIRHSRSYYKLDHTVDLKYNTLHYRPLVETRMATIVETQTEWTPQSPPGMPLATELVSNTSGAQSLLANAAPAADYAFETQEAILSRSRAVVLIATLSGVTFVGSMSGGLLTICLPSFAADLHLADNLLLW